METTLSHQLKVGIFTAIGLALFSVSVILLGGDKFFLSSTYHLRIRMPQVQGLGRGSVVSLSGVPVGNIDRIDFVPESSEIQVTVGVQKSVQHIITEGSLASVKTQGALGDKYVYIEPGPLSGKPLPANALLPMDKTPDFIDIIASKGAELGQVVEVIKEVHTLFAAMNQDGRSGKLMNNLVQSSEQLNQFLSEGRETFRFMRSEDLVPMANVLKKIDSGQGTLGALISDRSLFNKLSNMLGETPRNKFLKPLIRDSIETSEEHK